MHKRFYHRLNKSKINIRLINKLLKIYIIKQVQSYRNIYSLKNLYKKGYYSSYNNFVNNITSINSKNLQTVHNRSNYKRSKIIICHLFLKMKFLLGLYLSNNFDFIQYNNFLNNSFYYKQKKVLLLNFKRRSFFPSLMDLYSRTYFFLSLGMVGSKYHKGKSFSKKKIIYIKIASLVRKFLLYTGIKNLTLMVKRVPTHLLDIVNTLFKKSISFYKHPFNQNHTIDERNYPLNIIFDQALFINNKSYGHMKIRKRGRLKRKIKRKIILKNRVLD